RDGYFHADMHPGNIFVATDAANKGKYIALDFGIMGTLSERDKGYLAQNFLAFFRRDYRRVATAHLESGWVPPETRLDDLERWMDEQMGWRGLERRLREEGPFLVTTLPLLPRLLYQRLSEPVREPERRDEDLAATVRTLVRWLAGLTVLVIALIAILVLRQY